MAAQLGIFKVIGDSNIRNAFSTRLKISERISGLNTEFVSAAAYSSGMVALADLGSASVVLVSFLVNGMVDATELCSDLDAVDKVIENKVKEYVAAVRMAATINAGAKFYILPPLTRTSPIWFESKMSNINLAITTQSEGMANLILLPSLLVLSKDLEADGIHLNRATQSRLFSHIMDHIFPGERSAKTRNMSRDRPEVDGDAPSTPAKRPDPRSSIMTNKSDEDLMYDGDQLVDHLSDGASAGSQTLPGVVPPNPDNVVLISASPAVAEEVDPLDGEVIQNPELQQLYHMISKKIDSVKATSNQVSSKITAVELKATATEKQVECNTMILKSLHLRTAKQAEILDSHTNTLNLNVVMISGVPASLIRAPPGGGLPALKIVMDKIIKYTPLLVSGIKFATYAKYIKHNPDQLPNIKAFFINADTALAFRDSANKLRIAKKEFWSSVYVSNDPTKSTRVRICVLQAMAKRLAPLPANSGKTIFVSRFDVRPQLCFKFAGRVEKRYDYVTAVEKYRSVLTPEDRQAARKVAGATFSDDDLRQFIVL